MRREFYDQGDDRAEGLQRMAWLAFDAHAVSRTFAATPGRELAERLAAARSLEPFEHLRDPVVERLRALGSQSPVQARSTEVAPLELLVLLSAAGFAGGDQLAYWDDRVLPALTLDATAPIPPSELDVLDGCDSLVHAMVEVLPLDEEDDGARALMFSIPDSELSPLAPWVAHGLPYGGAIYLLRAARWVSLVRDFDLDRSLDTFARTWHRAIGGSDFAAWKQRKLVEGAADLERFTRDLDELRALLELASSQHLQVGVMFYG